MPPPDAAALSWSAGILCKKLTELHAALKQAFKIYVLYIKLIHSRFVGVCY